MQACSKHSIHLMLATLALLPGISLGAATETPTNAQAAAKPRIVILTTGGTIAGRADPRSHIGYNSAELGARELIAAAPGIEELAQLSSERVATIGSQHMNDRVWFDLAARIKALFASNQADGVVITHGTDTMEETAFFLDLILPRGKPVVLVGAMRPSTANSADGPANLLEAVKVAASPAARDRGVLVVMNDTIHGARGVQKMNTSAVNTFHSPNFGPVGYVDAENLRFGAAAPPSARQPYALPGEPPLPRVDIVYAHSQMDGAPIDDAVKRGARAIVVAGFGGGTCSDLALEAMQRAVAQKVVVVRASRVGSGFVNRNVEIDDDQLGFVASLDLNPQKARVLAQLLIANGIVDAKTIQQAFATH